MIQIATLLTILSLCKPLSADLQKWTPEKCPEACECETQFSHRFQAHLRTVDCSHQNFDVLPPIHLIPQDVQVLLLNANRIQDLRDNRLWFPNLLHLDLSGNQLRSLGKRTTFEGVYNLRFLDLSRNNLNHLKDNGFQGLFNLEELNLSNNRLSAISDDSFRGLSKLETLKLDGNRITFIHSQWWSGIPDLYELSLSRNRLSILQSSSFAPLENLLSLDLSDNKLFRLNIHTFAGLKKLEYLRLDGNLLNRVPRDPLSELTKTLKSLAVSRNPIYKLESGAFSNFKALKAIAASSMPRLRFVDRGAFNNLKALLVLEMHDSPFLAYVDPAAFLKTPSVIHLLLHNNNLTTLSYDLVNFLPGLKEVSFYGNPITCDCNAHWLLDYLQTKNGIQFKEAERMICDSPDIHRFKLFTALSPEEISLACPPRLIHLFDASITAKFGDDVTIDCRAVGVPAPSIKWVLPDGTPVLPDSTTASPSARVQLANMGSTLILRGISQTDTGLYTCIAENSFGIREAQTELKIAEIELQFSLIDVTATSVTLGWNGSATEGNIFQVLYRPINETPRPKHRYAGIVTPIMKQYSLEKLAPGTPYEVCLAFENDRNVVIHISCVKFVTRGNGFFLSRIERSSNVAVGAALGIVACLLIIAGLAAVGLKRNTNPKRSLSDPEIAVHQPVLLAQDGTTAQFYYPQQLSTKVTLTEPNCYKACETYRSHETLLLPSETKICLVPCQTGKKTSKLEYV